MTPIGDFLSGLQTYWKGVRWLKKHPKLFSLLFIPWVIGIILVVSAFYFFLAYSDSIVETILYTPGTAWWSGVLHSIATFFLYITVFILALVLGVLSANVVAAPIYEVVSVELERDLMGGQVREISLLESIKLIPEEMKKLLFIAVISIAAILVPGLNVLAAFISAFLIGWDFYDYPLARRGLKLNERLAFMRPDVFRITGLGMWLIIPFIQVLLLPLAVVGGSMLCLESIQKRGAAIN
jgi:CysZ protein